MLPPESSDANGSSGNDSSAQALPSNAYANAFSSLKPREVSSLLQSRLHKARILTDELADYFAARRELEAAYLKALQKISRRSFLSDPSALGTSFAPVYERLIAEIGEAAGIHGDLERKLEQECEIAMRSAPNKGEWGRQREHDDNIAHTLKEIQSLEQQLQKDQKKLDTASSKKAQQAHAKAQDTQRSLDQTMQLWEAEAPFAFEAYQRIDAQRLDLMKEAVTRFETAQSDAAQRWMATTEKTLQAVLSFDTQAEMQEFILKNGASPGAARPTPPARRRTMADRSNSVASSTRMPAPPRPTNGGGSAAEFGLSSSSASIHSNEQGSRTLGASSAAGGGGGGGASSGTGTGGTLKSAFSRLGRGRANKNPGDTATVYGGFPSSGDDRPRTAGGTRLTSLNEDAVAGGNRSFDERRNGPSGGGSSGGLMQPMVPNNASSSSPAPPPPAGASYSSTSSSAPSIPRVDSEGFSIPPPDTSPWASATASATRAAGDDTEEQEELAPRLAGMNIANKPISRADSSQDQAALERVRSTLLTAAPARKTTTRRDRRDVRNTTYNPMMGMGMGMSGSGGGLDGGASPTRATSTASPPASAGLGQFGVIPPQLTGGSGAPTFSGVPGLGADRTQSIVSMSSARAPAANPFDAPAGSPGLRASITETVNAILTAQGVARLMVTGEIALSLNVADVSSVAQQRLRLRLDAFEQLEKAAPNPALLQPLAARPGEYTLDVAALARTQNAATVLKYQVHVPPGRIAEYVPLSVDAKWRCEVHQTSFLLNYAANPSCKIGASASEDGTASAAAAATLQDLSFVLSVGPSPVTSVMSKPEGEWNDEQKRIYWRLPEALALPSSSTSDGEAPPAGKLLARFAVQGEGAPRPTQVRWRVPGRTMSALAVAIVPAAEDETAIATFDEVARQTVSGKYIAQ